MVSLEAPETVEVSISKGDDHYLIFLTNHTYSRRPFNEAIRVYNVKISLSIPFIPSKVIELIHEKELKYNVTGEGIKIRLPRLDEYSIILLRH